jgi:ribose transport system substrate-binding protein
MSRHRKVFWAGALVALAAAIGYRAIAMRSPAPPPAPEVVFITGGSEPYWQLTIEGAKAGARDNDLKLRVETPAVNDNLESQMSIFEDLDPDSYSGIAISPIDAEGQTQLINSLVQRDKRVVTFDSDAPLSTRQCFVGSNNAYAGATCAQLVHEALPEGGKVAVLLANLTKENMRGRKQGFEEKIAQIRAGDSEGSPAKFTVVGYFEDNGDMERCATIVRDTLSQTPDLAGIVGLNARHGPTLLKVLGELDKLGRIKLITFDDAVETLDGIEAGHIFATMAQDPYQYGYQSMVSLGNLCRGDDTSIPIVGRGSLYVNAEPIRKENVKEYRARMGGRRKPAGTKAG